jgi:DNA-binding response OmpR family regulator
MKGKKLDLTAKEFELLDYFLTHGGRVLSRDVLLNNVWGYDYFGTTRTVDVHVRRLREKLGLYEKHVQTVKGYGYLFKEEI